MHLIPLPANELKVNMAKMNFRTKVVCILFSAVLLSGCSSKRQATASSPPLTPVNVVEAVKADVPYYVEGIGQLVPFKQVNISPQVNGMITQVLFHDGDFVKQGQLLFTIDPRPFEAALLQAIGSLAIDQAGLVFAKRQIERYTELYKKDYYSASNFDQLITNEKSLEGSIERDQGAIALAKLNIEYSYIKAPMDGIIGIHQLDPGNIAIGENSQLLVTLVQASPIYAEFSIPESNLNEVRKFQNIAPLKVESYFQNQTENPLEGVLYVINNTVNVGTGMIVMRALIPNEDLRGWPGQYISTKTLVNVLKDSIVIPQHAIQDSPKGPFVYIIKPDMTAEKKQIQKGIPFGDLIAITQGIEAGEQIVVEGQLNLYPGVKVSIKNQAAGKNP